MPDGLADTLTRNATYFHFLIAPETLQAPREKAWLTAELYRLLGDDVAPRFADRDAWVELMKTSIATLAPIFSMQRAVIEYAERYYLPASQARSGR